MIATVEIADVGMAGGVQAAIRGHLPPGTPGLRWSNTAVAATLASNKPPKLGRRLLLAFWDDLDAADRALEGRRPSSGPTCFRAALRPVRLSGAWTGIERADIEAPSGDGPVVVFTLGRLRPTQLVRFLRTSRPAERAALEAPGFAWGTASARPPFVATVTVWSSGPAAGGYAHRPEAEGGGPAHQHAIDEQRRRDFHRASAFVRFEPVRAEGGLDGVDLGRILAGAETRSSL